MASHRRMWFVVFPLVVAFQPFLSVPKKSLLRNTQRSDDQLPEVEPGQIDWDSEWSKVVRGDQDHVERPKEAQYGIMRLKRRAMESTQQVIESTKAQAKRVNQNVKGQAFTQDTTFYMGCLAAVAFLPAIIIGLTPTGEYIV